MTLQITANTAEPPKATYCLEETPSGWWVIRDRERVGVLQRSKLEARIYALKEADKRREIAELEEGTR